MKCLIIDDEPLAIEILESYLSKMDGMEVVATCTNPLEAIKFLNKKQVDLVFLDIEMPNLTGIELIKSLDQLPQFIFTTAYPQYALQGFELNATDYLVKPIPFHRFLKAITRAREKFDDHLQKKAAVTVPSNLPSEGDYDDFIFVRAEYENVKLYVNDILFLEGLKDYIKIHIKDKDKAILTLSNFNNMLEKLPPFKFLRVHRSYVVNIHHISALQKTRILVGTTRIPIGETYKEAVLKRLKL